MYRHSGSVTGLCLGWPNRKNNTTSVRALLNALAPMLEYEIMAPVPPTVDAPGSEGDIRKGSARFLPQSMEDMGQEKQMHDLAGDMILMDGVYAGTSIMRQRGFPGTRMHPKVHFLNLY